MVKKVTSKNSAAGKTTLSKRLFLMGKPSKLCNYGSMVLRINQVARTFEVSPDTVRRWADKGILRSHTLPSGERRFRREDVFMFQELWLTGTGMKASPCIRRRI